MPDVIFSLNGSLYLKQFATVHRWF